MDTPENDSAPKDTTAAEKKIPSPGVARNFFQRAGKGTARTFQSLTNDSVGKTIAVFAFILIAVAVTAIIGVVLRFASPKSQITVAAFEVLNSDQKTDIQSGKVLADLLVDNLHHILEQAGQFSGNTYSSKKNLKPVPDLPQIPVATSYGIEIKGISIDQILATWGRLRYQEFVVGGDLMPSSGGDSIIRVRYETRNSANSYEKRLAQITPAALDDAMSELSLDLVKDVNPEAAARYLLAASLTCTTNAECSQSHNDAVNFCWTWTRREPANSLPYFYLGYSLVYATRSADALPYLEHAYQLNPESDVALNAKGNALLNIGRYEEAESAFEAALRIRTAPNPLMNLGVIAFRRGRFSDAVNFYNQAIAVDSADAGAFLNLGNALIKLNRNAEAVDAFNHSLDLQPANLTALYGLARSLPAIGKSDEAVHRCEVSARLNPESPDPLIAEAIALMAINRIDDAIEKLNASIARRNTLEAQRALGVAYMDEGDYDDATKKFDAILQVFPRDVRTHVLKAELLAATGDQASSDLEMTAAQQIDPGAKFEYWEALPQSTSPVPTAR